MRMCYDGIVPNWGCTDARAVYGELSVSGFFYARNKKGGLAMEQEKAKKGSKTAVAYWSLVGVVSAVLMSVQCALAESETIWDRFSSLMQSFYVQLIAISTIVAVTMAAVALIVRLVSRNQRTVDEATSWLKRIVITWIILNSLGLIVAYIQPLVAGGNYGG